MKLKRIAIVMAFVIGAAPLTACGVSDDAQQTNDSVVSNVDDTDTEIIDTEEEQNVDDGKHNLGDTISMTSDGTAEWMESEENTSSDIDATVTAVGDVESPIDMISDTDEPEDISGYYCGKMDQSSLSISIYTSPEDSAVGNVDIYVDGGEYAYHGEFVEVTTNTYQLVNDSDDEVLMIVYTEVDSDETSINVQLYVNGEHIENYIMLEHYES